MASNFVFVSVAVTLSKFIFSVCGPKAPHIALKATVLAVKWMRLPNFRFLIIVVTRQGEASCPRPFASVCRLSPAPPLVILTPQDVEKSASAPFLFLSLSLSLFLFPRTVQNCKQLPLNSYADVTRTFCLPSSPWRRIACRK